MLNANVKYRFGKCSRIKTKINCENAGKFFLAVIEYRRLRLVKFILRNFNTHINVTEGLMLACILGYLRIADYLSKRGGDIRAYNDFALRYACRNGNVAMVRYLHSHGANIQADYNHGLQMAACCDHIDIVRYLYENGANIQDRDNIAIKIAAESGNLDIVRYLHRLGADIMAIDLCHFNVEAYVSDQKFLVQNFSLLKRLSAKIYVENYHEMPAPDTVPTEVMDILALTAKHSL